MRWQWYAALTLLVWGFWAMLREPMTGWLAPTLVLAFCGAFIPAFRPLFDAERTSYLR